MPYVFIPDAVINDPMFGIEVPRRPFSYLVTPKRELIASPKGAHQTAMLSNTRLQDVVSWYREAEKIIDEFYGNLPKGSPDHQYWHRTELTNPLDSLLFDAFYEFGGHRLCVDRPYDETVQRWELTGQHPHEHREGIQAWLETSQPYCEEEFKSPPVELSYHVVRKNPSVRVLPEILVKTALKLRAR